LVGVGVVYWEDVPLVGVGVVYWEDVPLVGREDAGLDLLPKALSKENPSLRHSIST